MIVSHSPYTNKRAASYDYFSDQQITETLDRSHAFASHYKHSSMKFRALGLKGVAENLRAEKYELAELITMEMGKLVSESLAEIEKCAWVCDYYAENGAEFLAEVEISTDASYSAVSYRPLGVILGVMPWNFPFWQVFRFAAPSVMAGNVCILKHASNVPRCAMAIERLFNESSFDGPIFQTAMVNKEQVAGMIADPRISAVTLTGSEAAGKSVAAQAGKHLKKTVLELGGSDPYIILNDAEMDLAVETCVKARMLNSGQSCIGAKRFIVHTEVYEEFMKRFRDGLEKYSFGDPLNNKTNLAPLSSFEQRDMLHKQVLDGIREGAHLVMGGYVPNEIEGAFYPPTILTEIKPENSIYYKELFGPVAMVFKVESTEEAMRLANDTSFGLGGAIFSKDEDRAMSLSRDHLESGSCFVNAQVKSDPRLPFGGIKSSGYGRELSLFGIREFSNIKTIYKK